VLLDDLQPQSTQSVNNVGYAVVWLHPTIGCLRSPAGCDKPHHRVQMARRISVLRDLVLTMSTRTVPTTDTASRRANSSSKLPQGSHMTESQSVYAASQPRKGAEKGPKVETCEVTSKTDEVTPDLS
jgi:hypothetical protein